MLQGFSLCDEINREGESQRLVQAVQGYSSCREGVLSGYDYNRICRASEVFTLQML